MSEFFDKNEQQKRNNFRTAFIRCDCDSEVLVVRYDGEFESIDLCIYQSHTSFYHKMSWYQKLRYIYQVLRHGEPYTDQIMLQKNQVEELKGFLNSL
jgi:hypothetical protein